MSHSSKFVKVGAMAMIQVALISGTALGADTADANYEVKPINLPGATGTVALDYFAYDRATGKLWVPASNTGSVDVIDEKTDAASQVTGFPTGESSGGEERSQSDRPQRPLAMEWFTLGTAGTGCFA